MRRRHHVNGMDFLVEIFAELIWDITCWLVGTIFKLIGACFVWLYLVLKGETSGV
jgi:hypothetical protein